MRRALTVGVVISLAAFAATVHARQDAIPPRQRLVPAPFEMRLPLTICDVPAAAAALARRTQLVAGIEYLPGDCQEIWRTQKRGTEVQVLAGLTVEAALDKLIELDARYRWTESDGVILVRPLQAWADAQNWLNQPIGSFAIDDQDLSGAMQEVVCHIPERPFPERACHHGGMVMQTELGARRFSVKLSATSRIDSLNAIVAAHGAMWWEARDRTRPTTEGEHRMLWFNTPDGAGIGMPTKHYPSR